MRNGEDRLDELLRSRLEQYSADPPDRVWEGIRAGIAPGRKSGRVIYLRWLSAAAAVILALITGILVVQQGMNEQPILAEKAVAPASEPAAISPATAAVSVPSERAEPGQVSPGVTEIFRADLKPEIVRTAGNAFDEDTQPPARHDRMPLITGFRTLLASNLSLELRSRDKVVKEIPADDLSEADKRMIAGNLLREKDSDYDSETGWKLGLHLSPGYSSHAASYDAEYARNMTYTSDKSETNMGAGISLQYKTSSRWRVESGVYYSKTGGSSGNSMQFNTVRTDFASAPSSALKYFNTGVTVEAGQLAMNSTAGVISFSHTPASAEMISMPESRTGLTTAMLTPGEFAQVFDFVEIPVFARFLLLESLVDIELVGGISTNLVVGNNVYMESNAGRERVGSTRDISTLNFSGTAGVGFVYALGRNLSVSVEPRLNYYLNSLNHSDEVHFRPWRVGLLTGLSYDF